MAWEKKTVILHEFYIVTITQGTSALLLNSPWLKFRIPFVQLDGFFMSMGKLITLLCKKNQFFSMSTWKGEKVQYASI